jgi:hypothetical protein
LKRLVLLFVPMLFGCMLVGCGVNPGKNADPVDIDGKVTLAGKDVSGVVLNLQVTGEGTPLVMPVEKGACKGKVTPGKYTYFLSQASNATAFKDVPAKYREGSMDRQIEIKGPGPVAFNFE